MCTKLPPVGMVIIGFYKKKSDRNVELWQIPAFTTKHGRDKYIKTMLEAGYKAAYVQED